MATCLPSQGISFLHTKTGSGYQTHTCTGNERAVLRSPWLGLSESRERQSGSTETEGEGVEVKGNRENTRESKVVMGDCQAPAINFSLA